MSGFNKKGQNELKRYIAVEIKHREPLENGYKICESRLGLLQMEMAGATICIKNYNGTKETCNSLIATGATTKRYETRMAEFKTAITMSKWKEKFYRYIYLGDKENAKKYDKKLAEGWTSKLDEFMEVDLDGGKVGFVLNNTVNGKETKVAEKSEAIRLMGKSMTKAYEERKMLLSCI